MSDKKTMDLGLDRKIDRRDFIGGVAASAALMKAGGVMAASTAASDGTGLIEPIPPGNYPPQATGLRGQYPGSFEMAHSARDGAFAGDVSADDTGERYDLVIVGAGISGLSAAHFFRKALGDDKKVLLLDNHDDFGGHAKRNEFRHNGRTYVGYGGTMSIETPFPYSYTAKALIAELGIDVSSYHKHEKTEVYIELGRGVFFDREHFACDRVVTGMGERSWEEFFASAPLSSRVRADLTRLHT